MLTLLYLEPYWGVDLVLAVANGTATEDQELQIADAKARALIKRYGRRLILLKLDEADIATYIDDNPRGIAVKEYPVLVHCDISNNIRLYYLEDMFTDDFVVASMIESEMRKS